MLCSLKSPHYSAKLYAREDVALSANDVAYVYGPWPRIMQVRPMLGRQEHLLCLEREGGMGELKVQYMLATFPRQRRGRASWLSGGVSQSTKGGMWTEDSVRATSAGGDNSTHQNINEQERVNLHQNSLPLVPATWFAISTLSK